MIYLVLNIALFLIVAAGIGFGVGWLLRQQTGASQESEMRRGTMEIKSRIPQLETTIRNRDRELTRLSLELQDSQARIPELEETIRDRDAAVLAGDRNLRQSKSEITSLRGSVGANGSAGGENFAVLEDADLQGFDDSKSQSGDDSALQQQIQVLLDRIAEREQRITALEANGANDTGSSIEVTAELESRIEALETENAELMQSLPEPGVLDDRQRTIDDLQQQLDQVGTQLVERDTEISGLTAQVDTLTHESADAANEQGRAQVAERDLQIATLSARISDLDAEAEARTRELARLEQENRSAAEQIPKLEDAGREQDEARNQLQRQLDEQREDIGAQQRQMADRTADNERLQQDLATLHDQLEELRGELVDCKQQLVDCRQQLVDREQRIETLGQAVVERDELRDRCGQLSTTLDEHCEARDQAQATGTALEQKVRDLEQKLIAQASHFRGQADSLEAGKHQLETMTRASEALESQVPELSEAVGAAESALAESHAELDGARGRLTELEAQLSERDSTLVELNAKVAAQEESSRQLAEQNEQAERALTEQVSEQSGELESLAAQLREASEQAGAAEAEFEQKAAELTELQGSLSSAEERLPELEQTLQSITDERDSTLIELNEKMATQEESSRQLAEQNEQAERALTEQVSEQSSELESLAVQLDLGEVNAEATSAGQRCEQLEAELKGVQAKLVEFEGGLADKDSTAHGQVAELQQLVGERTAQLQELQTEATDQTRCLEEMTNEVAIKDELVAELERKLEQHSLDTARTSSGDAVAPPGTVAPEHQAVVRELDDRKRQITRLEREQGLQQQTMQVLSQQLEDARQTHDRLSGTIADREARISELESHGGADGESDAAQPSFLLESRPDDCDDLQRIRGIGTALEKALNELGVYRLRQIAALNDADIKWLDGSLKGFKGRIIRDAWIEQADELSFGDRPLDQP